ncbi:MAG: hypothetical protein QG670_647 [Thermoproteota archaeon]|nr:hypothetical protein [Thermoproteota archaeon]
MMKALVFEKGGLDNLKVRDVEKPMVSSHDVLIKIKIAGVNPVDRFVVELTREVRPIPHIPGSEFAGVVDEVGDHVTDLKKGERVIVYNRVFDDTCDMCLSKSEMLCRTGGIRGVITNGGFAEYTTVPERNAFKIPEEVSWEVAASLPVSALTPYHALMEAGLKAYETLAVFGASGNTGSFAIQFGRKFGAKVIAVSRKNWIRDFGADDVLAYQDVIGRIKEITLGKMADVVLNSLGSEMWLTALDVTGLKGRLVFFGVLTGSKVDLALDRIYAKQIKIIGTTGGTRKELQELIGISTSLNVRVWKKFKLEDGAKALKALSDYERDGRILLEI